MSGRYFSANITTTAETDIIPALKTLGGFTNFLPRKVDIVADASLSIKINGEGDVYSPLYEDTVLTKWTLHLDNGDVLISSLVPEENAVDLWIQVVF